MPHRIKPSDATAILAEMFPLAEDDYRDGVAIDIPAGWTKLSESNRDKTQTQV